MSADTVTPSPGVKDYYVSPHAKVEGAVSFGTGCVVLAGAHIIAAPGVRLSFHNYCAVEEYATIHVRPARPVDDVATLPLEVSLGMYNHFAARSYIECTVEPGRIIGEGNAFQSYCHLSGVASIGDFNVFAPFVVVGASGASDMAPLTIPSRRTLLAKAAAPMPTYTPSAVKDSRQSFESLPRYGTRSVAELPSMAQALLSVVEGGRRQAVLAENAEGDPVEESDGEDDEMMMEGSMGAEGHEGDEREVDSSGASGASSASDTSSPLASSSGQEGLDDFDTVTPQKQRLTAQYAEGSSEARYEDGQRGGSSGPGGVVSPAAVHAMLSSLPEQTERAIVQDIVKRCRYYLTLYAVL